MASGYGMNGGPGRCFPFWQEVLACYVVNTSKDDVSGQNKCAPVLEDYYECLHHKKEMARTRAMQAAYNQHLAKHGRGDMPSPDEVKTLGLIPDQKPEDVHIKPNKYLPYIKPSIAP